jgi:hypothetical protein
MSGDHALQSPVRLVSSLINEFIWSDNDRPKFNACSILVIQIIEGILLILKQYWYNH